MKHPGPLAWSFFFFWIDQKLSNFVAYQWAKLSPFTDDNTQYSHITTRYTVTVDDRQGEVWTVRLTFDWLLDLLSLLRFLSLLLHFLLLTFLRSLSTYRSKASANILQVLQINILWSCILTYSWDFKCRWIIKQTQVYTCACLHHEDLQGMWFLIACNLYSIWQNMLHLPWYNYVWNLIAMNHPI